MATTEALNMPLEEAMRTQRAIRRLKPDPVDDAVLLHLIELALKAPTGSNAQNWEFIVVKDPAVKARLARLDRMAWSLYGLETQEPRGSSKRCSGRPITSRRSR
jgi:nitroreductase